LLRTLVLIALSTLAAHAQSATFRWIHQIGGSAGQAIAGLATDPQGNIYIAGNTSSLDFPVRGAVQPQPGGSGLFRVDGRSATWENLYQAGAIAAYAVAADPRDGNRIFAGTANSVVLSRDRGATWATVVTPGVRINALTIDPTDSRVVYASTAGNGLLKSTDGGVGWSAINSGIPADEKFNRYAFGVWVDPNHPSVLFASIFLSGLLRSSDGGASWVALSAPGLPGQAVDLAFDPFRADTLYLSNGRGSAISSDSGSTWTPLALVDAGPRQPTRILPDPKREGVLYASSDAAFWQSTDRGASWTLKSQALCSGLTLDRAAGAIYAIMNNRLVITTDGFDTTTVIGPGALTYQAAISASGGHLYVAAQGQTDVFVVKLDPQGNTVYATYFGGSGMDLARAMAVDSAGNVYVTGITQSFDFPVTRGAYAAVAPAFLFKLNPDGSLAFSTGFSGGTPNAVAVDAAGRAFVAGVSYGDLPVTSGAYQTKFLFTSCGPGCQFQPRPSNGFLTTFDASGASLVFSTYFGSETEVAAAVVVLPDGTPVVSGNRSLYHFDAAGSSLLRSIVFATTVRTLSVDGKGNLLAAGTTQDPGFRTTPGAFQTTPPVLPSLAGERGQGGSGDTFVTRLDADLNILNSTLLGGENSEEALGVAAAPNGNIVVGGSTYSKAFPSRGLAQGSFSPTTGFVSQFTPDLSGLVFSTFTGDARPFFVRSVAVMSDGAVIFAGSTAQAPYFSYDALYPNLEVQAFVVRVESVVNAVPRIDSVVNAASLLGTPLSPGETFQVRGDGFSGDATLYLNGDLLDVQGRDRTSLTATVPAASRGQAATLEVRSPAGSATILVAGATASPGVFSRDGSGVGQGYILNKDGSPNSPANPAKEGEPITIFATGLGSMTFDQSYAVTDAVVDVRVDGFSAAGIVAILGPVAGLPGDVYQISVFVPHPADFAASNPYLTGFVMPAQVAVNLIVNGAVSQAGIALSVGH
jgi:uncharacterized protein (TIGR03437 family)